MKRINPPFRESPENMELAKAAKELKAEFAKGNRDFDLEIRTLSGKRLANSAARESKLSIKKGGAATYYRNWTFGVPEDKAPGLYSGKIPEAEMKHLIDQLASGGFRDFPPERPEPNAPIGMLAIRIQNTMFEFDLGYSAGPKPKGMVMVDSMLAAWGNRHFPTPEWNLKLSADSLSFKNGTLSARIKIENQGSRGQFILHPASPGRGTRFGLKLKYGEQQLNNDSDSQTPSDSKLASMQAAAEAKPGSIEVKPGSIEVKPGEPLVLDFKSKLSGTAPRGWTGVFIFNHYPSTDTSMQPQVFHGEMRSSELSW